MAEPGNTGNPVFDFRANFRRAASAVQNGLMLGGLALFAFWGILYIPESLGGAFRDLFLFGMCIGCFSFLAGIAWGFLWRRKLRRDFQSAFGPKG